MSRARWSLRWRMTRWFAVAAVGLVVVVVASSSWFLHESVARELDALAIEELDEMGAKFPASARTPETFAELAAELAAEHPANPLAWRVWRAESGEDWCTTGAPELLATVAGRAALLDRTVVLERGLRWRVEELEPGLHVGLVLDGSAQVGLLRRFELFALGLALGATALAVAGGWIVSRRVGGLLHRVAESARAVRRPEAEVALDVEGLPHEIREVVDALADMQANIRREYERAQLMIAGLAHELRSPVQNLLGETQVALLRERTADEYRAVLESHLEELGDLGRVVDNLVTLCAPSGATRSERELERFDLGREAGLRLRKEHAIAERRGVRLELDLEGDLELWGDREAILLALHNLVTNAVEWSPHGGRVRVRLEGGPARVAVVVDDEGPGVPAQERERIFEPFHKGARSAGARAGYGLGLALTRAAVAAHGGAIEVGSAPGGGARFRLELPRAGGDGRRA